MFNRGNRYRSFRTLGLRLRNFGRRLMRNYDNPQQAPDASAPALPPPSWQVQSEAPLMWQEESHLLPVDSQPQAEFLPDPSERTITPRRRMPPSTPPVQRQTQAQSPAQQRQSAPQQQQRSPQQKMSDDDILSNILDFHERREQEREQVRLKRMEQMNNPTPDVQAQSEGQSASPNLPRRRRMGVDYVDTRSIGGDDSPDVQADRVDTTDTSDAQSPVTDESPAEDTTFEDDDFLDDDDLDTVRLAPHDSDVPEPVDREVMDSVQATDVAFTSDTSTKRVARKTDSAPSKSIPERDNTPAIEASIQRSTIDSGEVAGDNPDIDDTINDEVFDDGQEQSTFTQYSSDNPDVPIQRQTAPPTSDPVIQRTPDLDMPMGDDDASMVQRQEMAIGDDDYDFVDDNTYSDDEVFDGGQEQADFTQASSDNPDVPIQRQTAPPTSDSVIQRTPDLDMPMGDDESVTMDDQPIQRDYDDSGGFEETNSASINDQPIQRDYTDDYGEMPTQIDYQAQSQQAVQRDYDDDGDVWDADWMDADEPRQDDFDDYPSLNDMGQMVEQGASADVAQDQAQSAPQQIQRQADADSGQAVPQNQTSMAESDDSQFAFDSTQDLPDSHDDSDFVDWVQDMGDDDGTIQRHVADDITPVEPVPRSPIRRRGAIISEVNTDDIEHLYDTHVPNHDTSHSEAGQPVNRDFIQRDYDEHDEGQTFEDSADYQEPVVAQWQPTDDGYDDGQVADESPTVNEAPHSEGIQRDTNITHYQAQSPVVHDADNQSMIPPDGDIEVVYPDQQIQRDWDDNARDMGDSESHNTNEVDIYTALVNAGAIPPSATQSPAQSIQRAPEASPPEAMQRQTPHDDDPIDAVYETFQNPTSTPQAPDVSRSVDVEDTDSEIIDPVDTQNEDNQPNIDQIARDVYNKLRDRLRIERERRHKK